MFVSYLNIGQFWRRVANKSLHIFPICTFQFATESRVSIIVLLFFIRSAGKFRISVLAREPRGRRESAATSLSSYVTFAADIDIRGLIACKT